MEALVITAEECNEVAVECSKIIRFGATDDNVDRLTKEVGDLMAMLELLEEHGLIDWGMVSAQAISKRIKLRTWAPNVFKGLHNETEE